MPDAVTLTEQSDRAPARRPREQRLECLLQRARRMLMKHPYVPAEERLIRAIDAELQRSD